MNKTTNYVFKFERKRLGQKTTTAYGEKYGPYLYRDIIDNVLLASWDAPNKYATNKDANYLYKGEDIGYNTDALYYYKNA
jgi:hypothetical protein